MSTPWWFTLRFQPLQFSRSCHFLIAAYSTSVSVSTGVPLFHMIVAKNDTRKHEMHWYGEHGEANANVQNVEQPDLKDHFALQ